MFSLKGSGHLKYEGLSLPGTSKLYLSYPYVNPNSIIVSCEGNEVAGFVVVSKYLFFYF